tara:strand:+ start:214 stop:372 length:159 start_codon:yes stop_codon:yes gene_type:complete
MLGKMLPRMHNPQRKVSPVKVEPNLRRSHGQRPRLRRSLTMPYSLMRSNTRE